MFGRKSRMTDISAPFSRKVVSKDPNSAPARPATIGTAAMTAPVQPPSANFVPNSWPNSGFRNSRQRGTRGG